MGCFVHLRNADGFLVRLFLVLSVYSRDRPDTHKARRAHAYPETAEDEILGGDGCEGDRSHELDNMYHTELLCKVIMFL